MQSDGRLVKRLPLHPLVAFAVARLPRSVRRTLSGLLGRSPQHVHEWLCAFLLGLTVMASGFWNAAGIRRRRRQIIEDGGQSGHRLGHVQKVPSATERLVDHPVIAWVIENSLPVAVAGLYVELSKRLINKSTSRLRIYLSLLTCAVVREEAHIGLRWLLINKVYSHIPFYSAKRKRPSTWEKTKDFLCANFPVIFWTTFVDAYMETSGQLKVPRRRQRMNGFRPLVFLVKLALCRVGLDFLFYAGHRAIHHPKLYWIHKKHHEHNNVSLSTNYHFSFLDMVVEAFIPFALPLAPVAGLTGPMTPFEFTLLAGYLLAYEMESHSGKPMPTIASTLCSESSSFANVTVGLRVCIVMYDPASLGPHLPPGSEVRPKL
eukprot:TRINITY_DN36870_c0_g1_i2.p1 TRINITY_DN36870_c0_g1~~TRINITY_DN36870_c0_g1_i2.p1  ORF type:complete len:375 (+),score=24.31 TRINITY_DN36870_c0_g1_i2:76-1200(+)